MWQLSTVGPAPSASPLPLFAVCLTESETEAGTTAHMMRCAEPDFICAISFKNNGVWTVANVFAINDGNGNALPVVACGVNATRNIVGLVKSTWNRLCDNTAGRTKEKGNARSLEQWTIQTSVHTPKHTKHTPPTHTHTRARARPKRFEATGWRACKP